MSSASGPVLDRALGQLGWRDLLAEFPATAVPLTFRPLGETGAHAPLLNDVLLTAAGRDPGGTLPLPYAGGSWVVWRRTDAAGDPAIGDRAGRTPGAVLDCDLPLGVVPPGHHPAHAAHAAHAAPL